MVRNQQSLFLIILFYSLTNYAQETSLDSIGQQYINEIIVTGSLTPTTARQSVYQVKSIDQNRIKQQGATRLQEVLAVETNLRFTQDLATGGSAISMQGIAGQNVKILVDGVPMVGRQGTSNEININQIDINMIARIEIVEGPMSVIYGADALAGVINIITKKAVNGKAELNLKIHEESVNTAYGWPAGIHNHSLQGGYSKKDWFTKGNISRNAFGGFIGNAIDRDYQWHPKTQYLASAVMGIDKSKISAHYRTDLLSENVYNPGVAINKIASDQNYFTNRWMHQVQLDKKRNKNLGINAAMAYTHFSRQIQSTTFDTERNDRRLSIAPGSQDTNRINGWMTRVLLAWKLNNNTTITSGLDINIESGSGGRISNRKQNIQDYGVITSADIKLNKQWQIKPGLRWIYNSVYAAPTAIPSIHSKWSLNAQHDLKFAYGRGFRAPSLRELYFSFFDSSHSIIGNTDLKSELSNSYSAAWHWAIKEKESIKLSSTVNVFYNTLKNMINFGQNPNNPTEVTYINIDQFKTKGITVNFNAKSNQHQLNASASSIARQNTITANDLVIPNFNWSPEFSLSYTWMPFNTFSIGVFQKYTGKLPYYESVIVNGSLKTNQAILDHYLLSDINCTKKINRSLQLSLGIRNLFDVKQINNTSIAGGVHTPGGNQAIGYGRSLFVTMDYNLGLK